MTTTRSTGCAPCQRPNCTSTSKAIRPTTAVDLARQNSVELPAEDPSDLYDYQELDAFLRARRNRRMRSRPRTSDVSLTKCSKAPRQRRTVRRILHLPTPTKGYRSPPSSRAFAPHARSPQDFSIESAIIPGINRELGLAAAEEYLDLVLANRGDDVIGIGLDYFEAPFPPELAPVYLRAQSGSTPHGPRRRAGPARFIEASLDVLGVDRIDHGYAVVDDPALLQRCRDAGVLFVLPVDHDLHDAAPRPVRARSSDSSHERSRTHALPQLDDPPMFRTDLCNEYVRAVDDLGFSRRTSSARSAGSSMPGSTTAHGAHGGRNGSARSPRSPESGAPGKRTAQLHRITSVCRAPTIATAAPTAEASRVFECCSPSAAKSSLTRDVSGVCVKCPPHALPVLPPRILSDRKRPMEQGLAAGRSMNDRCTMRQLCACRIERCKGLGACRCSAGDSRCRRAARVAKTGELSWRSLPETQQLAQLPGPSRACKSRCAVLLRLR